VSGVRVQKKAHRLGSYKAGKLEALKARKLPGLPAFKRHGVVKRTQLDYNIAHDFCKIFGGT
jgi:hypothetical protein